MIKSDKIGNVYSISGILGDDGDVSKNMKKYLEITDLLFVEETIIFQNFIARNNINFNGRIIDGIDGFDIQKHKKDILLTLMQGKNISIFESSGTACLVDPGYDLIDFLYKLKEKVNFNMFPIPGTGAIPTAISVSGFMMDKHIFLDGINENTYNELNKYELPLIYFNHYDTYEGLEKSINFMKHDDINRCFVGVNLGKICIEHSNLLIRGSYKHVYNEMKRIFTDKKLPDLIIIFDKRCH